MALSQDQLNTATGWLNSQWGGGFDGSGTFQPGAYQFDPNNTLANWDILGAGHAMGYSDADVSQILGATGANVSPDQIGAFGQQFAPQVGMGADLFNSGRGYDPGVNTDPFYTGGAPAGGGGGGPTASSPGAFGAPPQWGQGYGNTTKNPYLDDQIGSLTTGYNNNLTQNILPGIRQQYVANGGIGSSRQGIAEGQAIAGSQTGLAGAVANLLGNDYNSSQNRDLQRYSTDMGAYLQNQGQMLGYDTNQRQLDQSGQMLGANLNHMALTDEWLPYMNTSQIYGNFSGLGGTTTQNGSQGGGASGLVGGGLAGASFAKQMGWI